jgi:hypothetical protein
MDHKSNSAYEPIYERMDHKSNSTEPISKKEWKFMLKINNVKRHICKNTYM